MRDTVLVVVLDEGGVVVVMVVVALGFVRRFFFFRVEAGSIFSLLSPTKMLIPMSLLKDDEEEAEVEPTASVLVTVVLVLMVPLLIAEAAEAVGSMGSLMHSYSHLRPKACCTIIKRIGCTAVHGCDCDCIRQ